jgi:hypothetical protein
VNDDTKFAKAHQAIGEYFAEFSELERELGEAVKVVLDLETHDAADIVVAALKYPSNKASLVRAAVEVATKKDGSEPTAWKAEADDTLKEIIEHSDGARNTFAHSHLEPQEDGSVKTTRQTLSHRGQMTWGEPKTWNLKDETNEVRRLTQELREIKDALPNLDVPVGKIQWIDVKDLEPPLLTLREHAAANRVGLPTKTPTSAGAK